MGANHARERWKKKAKRRKKLEERIAAKEASGSGAGPSKTDPSSGENQNAATSGTKE